MKLIPAFVDSWDGVTLRIFIDGYTDGADIGMKAEVVYGFAERPDYTGFHVEKGDAVWVFFNDGDPNSPMVMGYRNMNTGGHKNDRRFRHTNIEHNAEEKMIQNSKNHRIEAKEALDITSKKITLNGPLVINGDIVVNGAISGGGDMNISGSITCTGNIHSAATVSDSDGTDTA